MTEPTSIVFEEPPPIGGGTELVRMVAEWLSALRDHPGKWARLSCPTAYQVAARIRAGSYNTQPGEFEAKGRDGGTALYARYIGGVA